MGPSGEFPGVIAVLREDGGTVGKLIGIHQRQAFLKIVHPLNRGHRPEDLAIAHAHPRLHMVKNRGTDKMAVLESGDHDVTAVQDQLGAFLNALVDPVDHRLLVLGGNHRPQFRRLVVGAAHLPQLGVLDQVADELVRTGLLHNKHRQRHAAHPRAAEGRVDDPDRGALQRRIAHDQRVVLRLAEALDPLAVRRRGGIDVKADRGGADIRNPLDIWML